MQKPCTSPQPVEPYFVAGYPHEPHESVGKARQRAGLLQCQGVHRSLQILHRGQVVDLKRF